MKTKVTRFCFESNGVNYGGTLPGHLMVSQIQRELLNRKRGCARIWNVRHETIVR